MIVAFTIWCLKKYGSPNLGAAAGNMAIKVIKSLKNVFAFLVLASSLPVKAQVIEHAYSIVRGKDVIGNMVLHKTTRGDTVIYKMTSSFKTRFVFLFSASTIEESVFVKGTLLRSSFYRMANGKVESDNTVAWNGGHYEANRNHSLTTLNRNRIEQNMVVMMFSRPSNVTSVFSDHHHVFITPKKLADNQYALRLPDKTENLYNYQGDLCSQLEIKSTFFNVKIVLVS